MYGKLKVLFLVLVMVALAGAAQADTVIPLEMGCNATYSTTWAGTSTNPFTSSLQIISGPVTGSDGNPWWTMEFKNWDGDGTSMTMTMRATETAVNFNGSANPHFEIGSGVEYTWVDEGGRNCMITKILSLFTTPAGTFDNVQVMLQSYDLGTDYQPTQYWKPGVGLIYEVTPNYHGEGLETRTMTAYATPVPPSLLLLGSGLMGLLGLRGFRRS